MSQTKAAANRLRKPASSEKTQPARKQAVAEKATAKTASVATSKTKYAPSVRRQAVSPEQAQLVEMLDETMARLDMGIAKERSTLDALLSRLAHKAA